MRDTRDFHLRPEGPADLDSLSELLVAVDASWEGEPFRMSVREDGLAAARSVIARPKVDSVVVEEGGAIVGYGAVREDRGAVRENRVVVREN